MCRSAELHGWSEPPCSAPVSWWKVLYAGCHRCEWNHISIKMSLQRGSDLIRIFLECSIFMTDMHGSSTTIEKMDKNVWSEKDIVVQTWSWNYIILHGWCVTIFSCRLDSSTKLYKSAASYHYRYMHIPFHKQWWIVWAMTFDMMWIKELINEV